MLDGLVVVLCCFSFCFDLMFVLFVVVYLFLVLVVVGRFEMVVGGFGSLMFCGVVVGLCFDFVVACGCCFVVCAVCGFGWFGWL